MASLTKNTKGLPRVITARRGRFPLVAAASVLAIAAVVSPWAFEGRASSRGPEVKIVASTSIVNLCPGEEARARVRLRAEGVARTCAARYQWAATGGRIVGEGPEVVWDFSGTLPGNSYDVTLTVEGGAACGMRRALSAPARVVVWDCPPRLDVLGRPAREARAPAAVCPNISLCCRAAANTEVLTPFSATLNGGARGVTPTFKWTLSGGEVASGQGTDSILVDAKNSAGRTMLTTLEVGGYGARCSATCATEVALARPTPRGLTLNVSVLSAHDRRPVPGASVSLYLGSELLADGERADEYGLFKRGPLAPGTYRVVVNSEGFKQRRMTVHLGYASGGPFVFSLDPLDIAQAPMLTPSPEPTSSPAPTPSPAPTDEPSEGRRGRPTRLVVAGTDLKWMPIALVVVALAVAAYMLLGAAGSTPAAALNEATMGTAAAATTKSDKVYCTVFGPRSATPASKFITQVFAHLKEQAAELDALARKCVGKTAERCVESKPMGREIERGTDIFFRLEMDGLEVTDPEQTIYWDGEIDYVTFNVKVPEGFKPGEVLSNVIFGVINEKGERVIRGHVNFTFEVVAAVEPALQTDAVAAATTQAPVVSTAQSSVEAAAEQPPQTYVPHEFAFISYASEDREEVLKRVQGIKATGTECFMDKLTFKTGEEWEAAIYRLIDRCDVFYLFWSRNASESKWIDKEIDLALEEQRENKVKPLIQPMPLEATSIVAPPEKLRHLHFDDPILDHIDAQKYRASQRQQNPQQN